MRNSPLFASLFWVLSSVLSSGAVQMDTAYSQLTITESKPGPGVHISLRHQPGWYSYWINPGETGLPTTLKWTLPTGITATTPVFPVPTRVKQDGIINFAHKKGVQLAVPFTVAPTVAPGRYRASVTVSWLVCKESCIPESVTAEVPFTVPAVLPPNQQALSDRANTMTTSFVEDNGVIQVLLPKTVAVDPTHLDFFPAEKNSVSYAKPIRLTEDEQHYFLHLKKQGDVKSPLTGWLVLAADRAVYVTATKQTNGTLPMQWVTAAVLAFFGGILLNMMPCVFPILSLKILAILAKSGTELAAYRREAWAYTGGVILSFIAVASLLVLLKSLGQQLGWGFQLQWPVVVLSLIAVMWAVSFHLWGRSVLPASSGSVAGSVTARVFKYTASPLAQQCMLGMLAVFVATPCTAPFMATAIGVALLQPYAVMMLLFVLLGAGFSAPFLILAYSPWLQRALPKPGKWMTQIQRGLAVPMVVSAGWLTWVLFQQLGWPAWLLSVLCYGVLFVITMPQLSQRVKTITLIGGIVMGLVASTTLKTTPMLARNNQQAFARLEQQVAHKQALLVEVTAAWCITCQFNKKTVLNQPDILAFLTQHDIETVTLDWTQKDLAVTKFLAQFAMQGIPFTVVYTPQGTPYVLPQILTKKDIFTIKDRL